MTLKAERPSRAKERLLRKVSNQDDGSKKRLNVIVDVEFYKRMRAKALAEDRNVSDITRELWVKYLSKS